MTAPEMERHYDFVAIGGGSAGFNAARLAAQCTGRVAVIDGARELGGLCILRGCMPSKALIHVADVVHLARHADGLGIRLPAPVVEMPAVLARKRRIIGEFADFRVKQLESGRFDLLRARARFVGHSRLELSDGTSVTADRFLIATGSRVTWPAVPGLREAQPWTSDEVLELDAVPESVLVLGGGVVACELAQYLARMGARVTQIQRSPQLLRGHSPEASEVVARAFREDGIELFAGTRLLEVARDDGGFRVRFECCGQQVERRARHCLNALGREPETASLNLAAAGVETNPAGQVRIDEYQRTTNPRVYAAGDCCGPHEIVHVAIQQAEVAVKHALGRPVQPVDFSSLLQVVFTDPQVATVGPGARELTKRGVPFLAASYPFDDHGKSILMEAKHGYVKVLAEPGSGRIVGAEIVGRDASEMIHVFAVAVSARLTVHDLLRAPWFHPTLTEIVTYPLEEIADRLAEAK